MHVKEILVEAAKGSATQFNLMPFGDLQAGSSVFLLDRWKDYVADVKRTRNVITIGMGDYTDHFRPTLQSRLRTATVMDEAGKTLDDMHRKHIKNEVLPLIKPVVMASHCLGLLGGHHDLTYTDGTNSTQYLCGLLKVPYLGEGESLLRVHLKISTSYLSFDMYATHGEGNGQAVGNNIAKLQRMLAYMDVDVALRGHSCDKFIFQEPQYYMSHSNPPRLRQRNRIIANTGSFSDGRAEGEVTYVEKKNLFPKSVGYVTIRINVRRDEKGIRYLVMGE